MQYVFSPPITSQSKAHLHLGWNRKAACFRFSSAMTDTCCSLSGILSAFLLPCFLTILQMSSTFLSVRMLSFSGLSSPCSLISNLAASGLNHSHRYRFCCHEAIGSGNCSQCTCWIPCKTLLCLILWQNVPTQVVSIFGYSTSELSFFLCEHLAHSQGLTLLVCSLCPACSLLQFHLLHHLLVPPAERHWY